MDDPSADDPDFEVVWLSDEEVLVATVERGADIVRIIGFERQLWLVEPTTAYDRGSGALALQKKRRR